VGNNGLHQNTAGFISICRAEGNLGDEQPILSCCSGATVDWWPGMTSLAYPGNPTVFAGDRLLLHVSTPAVRYRVAFYRLGLQIVHIETSSPRAGRLLPLGLPNVAWGWPPEIFDIPQAWPSGVYLAMIVDAGETEVGPEGVELTGDDVDGRSDRALFVVRGRTPSAPILYKLPLATYHAYNASGGGSIYHNSSFDPAVSTTVITFQRPGGGTGGALSFPEAVDVYDRTSPREGFTHWDLPMISWSEREGIAVDFCTDLDLDRDLRLLDDYRLLLSVGHDEYWSARMREAVHGFVEHGGNVAFFSANTSWWKVDIDNDGAMACVHPPVSHPDGGNWWRPSCSGFARGTIRPSHESVGQQ
jgi:hypothetical protein